MTSYFLRYTNNPQADLERGYSFVGYQLDETREEVFRYWASTSGADEVDDFDLDAYMDWHEDEVAQDNVTGLWGMRRSGLCGYGPFETLDKALAEIDNLSDQYEGFHYLAIFEGRQTFDQALDGQDDGSTFKPIAITQIIDTIN